MIDLPRDKKIILFDGVCNLCNTTIQHIIKNDKKDQFRFVTLQSDLGQRIIKYLNINTSKIDSVILYEPSVAYYYKANAALKIARYIGGITSLLAIFNFLPDGLKNNVYDYIAKNRYKWFGKRETCMLPTPELKAKFL